MAKDQPSSLESHRIRLTFTHPTLLSPTHPPQREPPPLRSAWSRCCTRSSDTERRGPPESQWAPGDAPVTRKETSQIDYFEVILSRWWKRVLIASSRLCVLMTVTSSCRQRFDHYRRLFSSYSSLGRDVSAANNFGPGQWFLTVGSLPEGDQSRHVWNETAEWRKDKKGRQFIKRTRDANHGLIHSSEVDWHYRLINEKQILWEPKVHN